MANNKVIDKDGNILLDLTEDDVIEADVISGKKFHTRDGVQRTGSAVLATKMIVENGMYNASDDSASGYSSVTVNVPSIEPDPIKDAIDAFTALPAKSWANLFYSYSSNKSLFDKMTSVKSSWFADSAQIVNMSYMFYACSSLTAVPLFNTMSVTDMSSMFLRCSNLTTVPLFNTSNVTNMSNMLNGCASLTTVPAFDTSNVTNMNGMFANCSNLTTVPAFDTSNVTNMNGMFNSCRNIEEIHMTGMKVSFDISVSTKFTRAALVEILGNLATVSSTQTLTMGSTNLAKLTDEDKAIATSKGWTLA